MVYAPIMDDVILLQDLAYVILVLKELNVKVSLIKNMYFIILVYPHTAFEINRNIMPW